MVRRRRQARGGDEAVEHLAVDGLVDERPDRAAGFDERRDLVVDALAHLNRSSWAGRTSSRTDPSRSHSASSPRTIAAGTPCDLPITNSAPAAISSAIATSVTCNTWPSASGVSRRSTTAAIPL